MSARFRARAPGPVSGQSCSAPGGRTGYDGAGFLLPFGCRHSLLGHPVPPRDSAPLTIGLPRQPARTRAGFPCSARARCGWGWAPSIPRGRRCLHGQVPSLTAACRLAAAGPCHPGATTCPGESSSRGISEGSLASPCPAFPRLWPPDGTGTLGLSPELHTPLSRTPRRMSGRGRASALPGVTSSASLTSSDALTHCERPHVAQVVESDLSAVDIQPAYDGHRDLLKLRRAHARPPCELPTRSI
jgi:hypothetical protein